MRSAARNYNSKHSVQASAMFKTNGQRTSKICIKQNNSYKTEDKYAQPGKRANKFTKHVAL
jgi:hypothetical protein